MMTPTLSTSCLRCPPRGRISPWGGPAAKYDPHAQHFVSSLPPEGAHFALGRPGGETLSSLE